MLYEITLDGNKLNPYQMGRISGMIHVLSGMPEKGYAFKHHADGRYSYFFEGDKDVLYNVQNTINKQYPGVMVEDID